MQKILTFLINLTIKKPNIECYARLVFLKREGWMGADDDIQITENSFFGLNCKYLKAFRSRNNVN